MPKETHILVVDDEPSIRDFIQRNLVARSFRVSVAANGMEALTTFDQETFDLVILDIMLPRMDGVEICRRIRQISTVPILILTALEEEVDKIAALDEGADDYVTKPFSVGELMARVRALLRRAHWLESPPSPETIRIGALEIDVQQRRVWRGANELRLTPTEFELLRELAAHPGKLFTHEALLSRVWGPEYHSETDLLRVYIGRLRRKIELDPAHPAHILTEQGIGYYLLK